MEVNQKGYIPPADNRSMPSLMELGHVTSVAEQYHAVNVEGYRNGKEYSLVKVAGMAYWLPQVGDMVILAFIDGYNEMPIVLNKVMGVGNELYASKKDDIHIDHVIKDADNIITGIINLRTDKYGNCTITMSGIQGNFNIKANGQGGNITLQGNGALAVRVVGDADIETSGNLKLSTMGDAEIDSDGDVNVKSRGNADITVEGNVDIKTLKEEGIINFNNGEKGIARNEDKVYSDVETEKTYWEWLSGLINVFTTVWVPAPTDGGALLKTSVNAFLTANPVPSSMTSKIIESSETVRAGD